MPQDTNLDTGIVSTARAGFIEPMSSCKGVPVVRGQTTTHTTDRRVDALDQRAAPGAGPEECELTTGEQLHIINVPVTKTDTKLTFQLPALNDSAFGAGSAAIASTAYSF